MIKPTISETFDEMHERFLMEALKKTNGSRKETAKLLGISTRTVIHKMTKYGIICKISNQPMYGKTE
jgi:DNA-binding NtrC family response regulator